jgi:hypothetical protein
MATRADHSNRRRRCVGFVPALNGSSARKNISSRENSMAIGILLILLGIDMFCALLFTLAVYALPIFIGLSAGL